jgi:hypothetical protein
MARELRAQSQIDDVYFADPGDVKRFDSCSLRKADAQGCLICGKEADAMPRRE